jgi:pyruvate kinase
MTRTRIVATIGPASESPETIDALLAAGVNVARVNCAHGTVEDRTTLIRRLRERAAMRGLPLAILADLGGPKLRIGRFAGGAATLEPGGVFTLTTEDVLGDATRASIDYPDLPADVAVGDAISLNDGLVHLRVTGIDRTEVRTRVEVGGPLGDHKGLSVPGAALSLPSLTDKDRRDLDALAAEPPDFVGLSFVRAARDIELLREALAARRIDAAVVAKIEKAQAVEDLAAIVAASDAVMVARGDLGVECPIAEVPVLQKKIIHACGTKAVPVITATQMLESMVDHPRPTRAEASDVANATLDGSDAVMLSGETAAGRYPVETVAMMRAIVGEAERFAAASPRPALDAERELSVAAAVGRSACLTAEAVGAGAIVCLTRGGATASAIARWRPRHPILVATPSLAVWRRLSLVWGVDQHLVDDFGDDFDRACAHIAGVLRERGRLTAGTTVVITAGLPFARQGRTNTVRIERV